jgi:hypothetical protein
MQIHRARFIVGKEVMPSILSRWRIRAVSQSSHHSAQVALPAPMTTTTVGIPTRVERANEEQHLHEPQIQGPGPVTQKIYPDLDLLRDELAAEPTAIRHGLPPPVRRGLTSSSNPSMPVLETTQPTAPSGPSAKEGDDVSPKASHSSGSSGHTTPSARGFIERLGNWSTFGRRRAPPPSLNEFGVQVSPSPSAWRAVRANSRRSSRPSFKTASTHSSPHENKENTPRLSSQSSSGRRTPAAAARSNSNKHISTPVARELGFDSPRTLGHPSPEVHNVPSAPPPLPPLDHPALRSRAETATYPPRARSVGVENHVEVTPGQFTFGKSLRPYRSLPRVQQIFKTRMNMSGEEGNQGPGGDGLAVDAAGNMGGVPVPTAAPWASQEPIRVHSKSLSLLAPSIPSSSSSSSQSIPPSSSTPLGSVDPHDPVASNLYDHDPNVSIFGRVARMQQDAPRVRDKKPLRSSLKASARPSPTPIASSSSSNTGSTLMPSFSLVAAVATASDGAPLQTPVSSPGRSEIAKGKRKAEDVDITPPDSKKATFAVPGASHVFSVYSLASYYVIHLVYALIAASPRQHTTSAPSSYKRARLSAPSPSPAPPNAHNTGTYSSRASSRARAPSSTGTGTVPPDGSSERGRRRSLSQRSIPISALVTPHAPSVGRASSAYHMRDPRRPSRRMETGWALRFRTAEEDGSPVQAWLFYIALVLFPLWWLGSVWRIPQTRVVGGTDTEKAVPLDDPQIEFGACLHRDSFCSLWKAHVNGCTY